MDKKTLKDLGVELKKLELKEDDIIIVETDLDKINPKLAGDFLKIIVNSVNNKIIPYPKGMNIKNIGKENIIRIKNRFNKMIDKILKGEE